jgi:hypothetical protein
MGNQAPWVFIDDQMPEAEAFAKRLSMGAHGVKALVVGPIEARARLQTGELKASGVLMDVDLSNTPGELGTGLGIAQDLRSAQKAGTVAEMPIVRFARRDLVKLRVGGDPASDDLFDLKIDKVEVGKDYKAVQCRLTGVQLVYEHLSKTKLRDEAALTSVLGLDSVQLADWSHPGLHARLADGRNVTVHVAAGAFMRTFLELHGLLIDRTLLAFRLGIAPTQSKSVWTKIRKCFLQFQYSGIAHDEFERWWARGLDEWWLGFSDSSPLASLTIAERVNILRKKLRVRDLAELVMPPGSAGGKPWRICSLSLEADEPKYVPVDPSLAVRLTPRVDLPPWADPLYASLGEARRTRDARLDRSDLDRLSRWNG